MIIPAILEKTKEDLLLRISQIESLTDMVHIDIMDGSITDEKTFHPSLIKNINIPSEIHFMCNTPSLYINDINGGLVQKVIIQREIDNFEKEIKIFKDLFITYGSLDIGTPTDDIKDFIDILDGIMLMSVKFGKAGQEFNSTVLGKIDKIKNFTNNTELDGGITLDNVKLCYDKGIKDFAISSSIYKSENIKKTIENFNNVLYGQLKT
ncbi:hypothetical protein M1145_02550 [Patescibacteria group bacterium]|nr:hypothetical protein [Patescibacteria group bacterium]